jgi:hypothetical protein
LRSVADGNQFVVVLGESSTASHLNSQLVRELATIARQTGEIVRDEAAVLKRAAAETRAHAARLRVEARALRAAMLALDARRNARPESPTRRSAAPSGLVQRG